MEWQKILASIVSAYSNKRKTTILVTFAGLWIVRILFVLLAQSNKQKQVKLKLLKRRQQARERTNIVEKQCRAASIQDKSAEDDIAVEWSAEFIAESVKNKDIRAIDVLHQFQRKALNENNRLNFATEFLPEAQELAIQLDNMVDTNKKGLLFGVPVSIKENFFLKGYDSTAGLQIFVNEIAEEDSVIVETLKEHGAVPFVRTNIPQAMLSYSCSNPLYLETSNPHDTTRGPGGSSGGEGAIIGSHASVVGIGTDIGGSIRAPAEFCGIYGLKPTVGRISLKRKRMVTDGQTVIQGVPGPMARDFRSLVLLSQALLSKEMFEKDKSLPCMPFDYQEYSKTDSLRIGYFTYDGVTNCQPSNIRAVIEAKAALENQGHKLVSFDFPVLMGEGFQNAEFCSKIIVADRSERLQKLISDDVPETSLKLMKPAGLFPSWVFRGLLYIFGGKDKHVDAVLKTFTGFRSLPEYFDHIALFSEWKERFMKLWIDHELDAVICPVFSAPAPLKEILPEMTSTGSHCQLFNSLNYPAGVVPVTKVTREDVDKTFDPMFFKPESICERKLQKSSRNAEGLSVGVQCATLPFKEELCLRVMRELVAGLKVAS